MMFKQIKRAILDKIYGDDFVWALAEALLWRDEEVSMGDIPSPIRERPDAKRYYEDAEYLLKLVQNKYERNANNDT